MASRGLSGSPVSHRSECLGTSSATFQLHFVVVVVFVLDLQSGQEVCPLGMP